MLGWLLMIVSRGYVVALFMGISGMIVYGFIRPYIVFRSFEEYGLLAVAFLTAGFMVSRGLTSLYTGLLITRRGYGFTGSTGLLLLALTYYLYTIVPTNLYPFIRLLEGFASGLLWPSIQALVVASVPSDWRARGLSLYFVLSNIAYYFSVWLASPLKDLVGYSGLFIFSIMLLIVLAIVYWFAMRGYGLGGGGYTGFRVYGRLFRETIDLVPLAIVMGGVAGLSLDYLLAYARSISGFNRDLARLYWSYAGYISLGLSLVFSYLADRYGGEKINYGVTYLVLLSLMAISIPSNPVVLYTLLSLPLIGTRIFRPIIRSTMVERTGMKELAITYTNMLMNFGAAFITLLIALINYYVSSLLNLGLIVYSITALVTIAFTRHRIMGGRDRKKHS